MRVLVIGLNYAPEQIGIAVYTSGMAQALAAMGHEVHVIAGQPYYPAWSVAADFRGPTRTTIEGNIPVTRVPFYVPSRPCGLRRLLHHLSFAVSVWRTAAPIGRAWHPHIVWTVAPSLIAAPVARRIAAHAGAPAWLHTQDFEVEAAFVTRLLDPQSMIGRLACRFQRWAMDGFAVYSSISPKMCDRLRDMGFGSDQVVEFRNWADVRQTAGSIDPDTYRTTFAIATPHVALYSGNISNKQGIGIVVEVARLLADRTDLTFVVCGEGPQLDALKEAAAGLANIRFFTLQPAERLGELLGMASVHLLPQLAGAADLVLPSKLTNMLASGRPIVATASPGTGLAEEVEGCGFVIEPGDAAGVAAAITRLLDDDGLRQLLGDAARDRAERRWSKATILLAFEQRLAQAAQQPSLGGVSGDPTHPHCVPSLRIQPQITRRSAVPGPV